MSILQANGAGLGGKGDPGGALSSFYDHTLGSSLRFDDGSSHHLTFTPSSAGSQTTWTWSAWIKRGTLGTKQNIFNPTRGGDATNESQMDFTANDQFQIYDSGATRGNKVTTRRFKDPSAWYHIVVALDTTNGTAEDRVKIYVNGERETVFSTNSNPGASTAWGWNAAHEHSLGSYNYSTDGSFFDGYMAEVHFIDGTALDPTSFGETKGGVWIAKDYSGSYGSNGWHLPFSQDEANGASAFFDEDDNSYIAWTDPGTEYEIGASDDYTLELFFNPTPAEMGGSSYIAGYYRTTSPSGYFAAQLNTSSNVIYLYHGNGAAYSFSFSAGDIVAGQWHHLAFNRSSGNLRCFLDGAQKGSTQTSNTKTHDIPEFRVNKAHATSNVTFDGYISNVRWVIGSAVYADGSSITVPTSTLTAVTNTKILACTTTTVTADASSNNVTGTTSGGDVVGNNISPFADFNFYDDRSGNNNDWTPNNHDPSDIMLDSPTNNFATWNVAGVQYGGTNSPTVSEGSLKAATSGNPTHIYGTFAIEPTDTQGYYWEVKAISLDSARSYMGIVSPEGGASGASIGSYQFKYKFVLNMNDDLYGDDNSAGGGTVNLTSWTTNDILMFAYKDGKFWIGKNGTWMNSGDPAGGTGDLVAADGGRPSDRGDVIWYPYVGYNSTYTANFGQDSTFAGTETAGGNSDENGNGDFKYSVPSGFLAMCSDNLPEPTIGPNSATQADDYFNTILWSGNSTNNRSITTGHATDLVWIKKRGTTVQSHVLADSVRGTSDNGGTGNVGILTPNSTAAVSTNSSDSGIASFDSTGFTIGAGSNTANADAPYQGTNASSHTYVGWSWAAGGTAVSNSEGSLACNVSANTKAGFSIVTWTATNDNGTLGHGLNSAPEMILAKPLGSGTNWYVMHTPGGVVPANQLLNLDSNADDFNPGVDHFNDTYPTDTVFSYGGYLGDDLSDDNKVAYLFHSVEGYSRIYYYKGNSSTTNGPFVFTGFRPAWVMGKAIGQTGRWWMYDSARTTYNDQGVNNGRRLEANTTAIEKTSDSSNMVEFYSNGFKVNTSNSEWNGAGLNYIYLAFAEAPFKYANAK